ncbi:MAG: VWA domain-containing protein, partial [Anaerolineae bacterium]|nr:VWA domain-containing protein [Anaerolineae bacterium]
LITDGWDRGDPAMLRAEMARLRRNCHRLIWLNPLLGAPEYEPLTRGASRYAVVGVCVVLHMNGGTCQSARVAVGGATVKAVRSPGAEAALTGSSLDDAALNDAANAAMQDAADYLTGDMTFPQDYRQAMLGVYLKRAVRQATG